MAEAAGATAAKTAAAARSLSQAKIRAGGERLVPLLPRQTTAAEAKAAIQSDLTTGTVAFDMLGRGSHFILQRIDSEIVLIDDSLTKVFHPDFFSLKLMQSTLQRAGGVRLRGDAWAGDLRYILANKASLGARLPSLTIDPALLAEAPEQVAQLAEVAQLYTAYPRYGLRRVHVAHVEGHLQVLVEVKIGLLLPLEDAGELSNVLLLLDQPIRREDIRVVSLFSADDGDVLQRLREAAGNRLIEVALAPGADGIPPELAQAVAGKIPIFVGHIENDAYVVRDTAMVLRARIPLQQAAELGMRDNGMPLMLGCSSFVACKLPSGLLAPVWDTTIAKGVARGLEAQTYGDLLRALGSPDNPLVIRGALVRGELAELRLTVSRLDDGDAVPSSATTSSKRLAAFVGRVSVRMVPTSVTLEGITVIWLLTLVVALIFPKLAWSGFARQVPAPPNRRAAPFRHIVVWLVQAAAYIALAPIVLALVSILAFTSAVLCASTLTPPIADWERLGKVFYGLWSILLMPFHFLRTVAILLRVPFRTLLSEWLLADLLCMLLGLGVGATPFLGLTLGGGILTPAAYIGYDPDPIWGVLQSAMVALTTVNGALVLCTLTTMLLLFLAEKLGLSYRSGEAVKA